MKRRAIETAPMDGTEIIVFCCVASVWIAHIAWWRDEDEIMGFGKDDVGWWSYTRTSVTQEKLEGCFSPSHWIPLPELEG